MATQRDFLDGPYQFPQGIFLLFKNIRRGFRLPKRLKIVFEQAADPAQFRDGVQVEMRGKSASEKTPPHVFRQGQTGDFRLLREARFFRGAGRKLPYPILYDQGFPAPSGRGEEGSRAPCGGAAGVT